MSFECRSRCRSPVSIDTRSRMSIVHMIHHFNTDFATMCKKIPRYLEELMRQMADHSLPSTIFTACLSIGLSNSQLATSFSPIDRFQLIWKGTFPCCVVTKLLFCIILLCFIFIQIPWLFSSSWAFFVGQIKSIKEMLLKGIWEWINLLMLLQMGPAFFNKSPFSVFCFPKSMPESWGCHLYTIVA